MKSITKSRFTMIWFLIFFLTMALTSTQVGAGQKVKLEGTIKGIKCTHYKVECVNSDRFITMEPDFVLVVLNGDYYFMSNLSRSVKIRHAYRKVVVHGDLIGQELWVDKMDDMEGKKRRKTPASWDWSRQDEFWESR
jgi:hypothetical protein